MLLFVASALVAIFALRHNNITMIKLRDAVYAADKSGNNVDEALNDLRSYVYAHMNTDLSSGGNTIKPPVQLKYTYERLESAAAQAANNSGLYTEAENYCQAKIPAGFSGRGRVPCVEEYILNHGGKAPEPIPAALYQFDFVSPSWSPDLAGWSLVATGLSFIGLVTGLLLRKFQAI